ncbi:MAG: HEAT repeat domain-containing protein [Planctomycetota bacterium]
MLVYICDNCHTPLQPDEAKKLEFQGGSILCKSCRAKPEPLHAPSPKPGISCEDCQVAVSQGGVPGGSWGDAANVFCSTCEKLTGLPGKKFRCHDCRSMITIADLREGHAVAVGEKAFCSTCRRRVMTETAARPKLYSAKPKENAFAIPNPPRRATPPPPIPETRKKPPKSAAKGAPAPGSPLECDLCHRAFTLEELRNGKAEIREGRVLCPRCIARIDRKKSRFDYRFAASLVFILVVFPIASAGLIFLVLTGTFGSKKSTQKEPPSEAAPLPTPPWNPSPETAPEPSPAPAPGNPKESPAPNPGGKSVKGIGKADLNQIIKNLRESRGGRSGSNPEPPVLEPFPQSKEPRKPKDYKMLQQMIASPDPAVRMEGILRISSDGEGTELLITALKDEDPFVRSLAATTLGHRKDEQAIGALLGLIRDPVFMVRRAASIALVDAANLRIKFAEDFTPEELEKLQDYINRLLEKKKGQ